MVPAGHGARRLQAGHSRGALHRRHGDMEQPRGPLDAGFRSKRLHSPIGMDSAGNATVVWHLSDDDADDPGLVQTARFTAATGGWSNGPNLSTAGSNTQVAVDPDGNATAVWQEQTTRRIRAARYARTTGLWGDAVTLATGSDTSTSVDAPSSPQVSVDAGGNVIVVWQRHINVSSNVRNIIQAARFAMVTATWSGVVDLSASNCPGCNFPDVAMDPNGNAQAVWSDRQLPSGVLQAARYTAATDAWAAPVDVSSVPFGEDAYAFPEIGADAAGNFTVVWSDFQFVAKAARYTAATETWEAPTQISDFGDSSLQPRVTVDAFGNATAVWTVNNFTGRTIQAARYSAATDAWGSVTNLSEVDVTVGGPDLAVDAAGTVTVVWFRILDIPTGSSVIQSRRWISTSGPPPGPPTLTGSVGGSSVHLQWTAGAGSAPTSYILQAGATPGSSNLFNRNVGFITSIGAPVSPGTYYIRVRAMNAAGVSLPSNEVVLIVAAPGPPTVTSAIASGGILTVSWMAGGGSSPTSHRLDFYSGAALVATVNAGAGSSIAIPIPPTTQGTFGVRVTARNGTVAGPPSALFTFTVEPACTLPASPNVSGAVVAGTASVSWPPVPGATAYILSAGTTQGGTQYLPATNIGANTGASASGLPTGFTAWVRVIAMNACGQPSAPQDFFVQ